MFYHLGRIATRFRWLIVGLWMVAIAVSLPFAPQASQVLHSGGFVSPDADSERALNLLVQKVHLNLTIVQGIFTSAGNVGSVGSVGNVGNVGSADSPQFIQESQQALARVRTWSKVSGVVSLPDNPAQVPSHHHAGYVKILLHP